MAGFEVTTEDISRAAIGSHTSNCVQSPPVAMG